ncbi:hypothetical protein HW555_002036 [Spodoptera exigua]|uniref:Uncharacterized protein n=1 Tax=Spodoptera exigua TaxID=7107 RepID=A0A835GRA3_SPOEX|nr:hypothetical protein HW555_002036 [Spodoptera exigua]
MDFGFVVFPEFIDDFTEVCNAGYHDVFEYFFLVEARHPVYVDIAVSIKPTTRGYESGLPWLTEAAVTKLIKCLRQTRYMYKFYHKELSTYLSASVLTKTCAVKAVDPTARSAKVKHIAEHHHGTHWRATGGPVQKFDNNE